MFNTFKYYQKAIEIQQKKFIIFGFHNYISYLSFFYLFLILVRLGPLEIWARGHGPNGPYVNPGLDRSLSVQFDKNRFLGWFEIGILVKMVLSPMGTGSLPVFQEYSLFVSMLLALKLDQLIWAAARGKHGIHSCIHRNTVWNP